MAEAEFHRIRVGSRCELVHERLDGEDVAEGAQRAQRRAAHRRVALAEKGLEYKEHLIDLRGGQFDPAYMKLNPNAVVPTLVHDGRPV
ncbi:MAG: glutathione S-transferase family protein, partial [Myxococcales bacterium]